MQSCRVCQKPLEPFMSFGPMPIANGFLTADETDNEYFFELQPAFCPDCFMFQLVEQPPPSQMFHEHYAFVSSTSRLMQDHFLVFADDVITTVLGGRQNPFVVEIGSTMGSCCGTSLTAAFVISVSNHLPMWRRWLVSVASKRSASSSMSI